MPEKPIRVIVAKVGLDGHDRGAKVVARTLRDAGMEVIYTGLHRTPEEVATAAIQEDVDVLGVSVLSGAHMTLVPAILDVLKAQDAADIPVVVGGVFTDEDADAMTKLGVGGVLPQDTPLHEVVRVVRELAARRERASAGPA
jgi:methylmalonyl-CoA mutase C-terminal domain/subunit